MGEFTLHYGGGLWYGTFSHFIQAGVRHGISARLGGVSTAPFNGLNLGLHTGDAVQQVAENRRRFAGSLQLDAAQVVTAQQVHGDRVQVVTGADCGRGAFDYNEAIFDTDALITNEPGVPLLLFFADCVPVLFYDPVHRAIGAAHAGWKGTVAKIAQKTLLAMNKAYGTQAQDCLVGIAPSIGPCCYEVHDNVSNQVREVFARSELLLSQRGDRQHLDLWQANTQQLEEIGVKSQNIVSSQVCTACNSQLFFSYRADQGVTGRLGALITL